jgi:tetratricopeptide (TPR) repeat protein/SAM-dependent methyltransferase
MRRPARIAQGRRARPVSTSSAPTAALAAATAPRLRPRPTPAPVPDPAVMALVQAAVEHHQAGRYAEAERQYRQVLAADPQQPDALHLLGVLAYQVGRADAAVPLIEQAIQHRPAAPAFRMNLGNALLALGRTTDAVASYREAAALAPTDAESHYNLGNALLQLGHADEGIAALRRTLALRPSHVAARYNLGNALRAADCLDEAAAAYAAVIRLEPAHADAHTNLGSVLHALGRPDEAAASFMQALAAKPDAPTALANVGEALREQGRTDAAADYFQRALERDPQQTTALRSLAALAQRDGQHAEAADLLARLVAAAPGDPAAHEHYVRELHALGHDEAALQAATTGWERHPEHRPMLRALVDLLQAAPVPYLAGPGQAALLAACREDTFDVQQLATPISRIIMASSGYPTLPAALLTDPAVLAALPRLIICAPEIECLLTTLRRSALFAHTTGGAALPRPFRCALAGAAFLVEYTWHVEQDEMARLATLHAELAALLADPASDLPAAEDALLTAALYGRLGLLSGAERLAAVPADSWSAEFVPVLREQVLEPLRERRIAEALPLLTPLDDATSQLVRAMYEQNPYPRWRAARANGREPLADRFHWLCPGEPVPAWPTPLPVLVAGAGTGRHPIQVALRLPDADVLAVDLSRASLAYGARMAQERSVGNIRFAQADILALDDLNRQFAHIECGGVLHHLADPMAGWAVLRRLLRPDGLMLIALYSERARTSIVAARALIADEAIPTTSAGIRAARRRIMELPAEHPVAALTRFGDFYSESGFRDLAMHVQEHRFTPLQLAAALDALDLRFLGFEVPPEVQAQFLARFPWAGADRDLGCWDQFEADHPLTFASMYQLWCRPR